MSFSTCITFGVYPIRYDAYRYSGMSSGTQQTGIDPAQDHYFYSSQLPISWEKECCARQCRARFTLEGVCLPAGTRGLVQPQCHCCNTFTHLSHLTAKIYTCVRKSIPRQYYAPLRMHVFWQVSCCCYYCCLSFLVKC